MKHSIIIILLSVLLPVTVNAKKNKSENPEYCQPVFMYGLATSFTDSIAYLTDVQYLDSAYLERGKFLGGITEYVSQLTQYFTEKNDARLCAVFFATSQKKAEKRYIALRKRYTNPKYHYQLKPLTKQEFTFSNVRPDIDPNEMPEAKEAEKAKKDKKARKQ